MSPQTDLRDLIAKLLAKRIGESNGISADDLAVMAVVSPRKLREIITSLRDDGMPICGTPTSGYFIAETAEELQRTCSFLRMRALRSLYLEARLKKVSLATLLGQMRLEFDNQG